MPFSFLIQICLGDTDWLNGLTFSTIEGALLIHTMNLLILINTPAQVAWLVAWHLQTHLCTQ